MGGDGGDISWLWRMAEAMIEYSGGWRCMATVEMYDSIGGAWRQSYCLMVVAGVEVYGGEWRR